MPDTKTLFLFSFSNKNLSVGGIMTEICNRCGKEVKNPIWINGKPYGKICANNINKPLRSGTKVSPKRRKSVEDSNKLDKYIEKEKGEHNGYSIVY